jgi:peptidoglycan/LPS O-acetylase OafA/YrhL
VEAAVSTAQNSGGTGAVGQPRYAYIDALRGYAILGVIAVHASAFFPDQLPGVLTSLTAEGARGVQLFFVTSALTLSLSWNSRADGAAAFYIRRLFRIAPMFWLAIIYYVGRDGFCCHTYAPDGFGWRHVAMAALFVHGFLPDTITSVVPGSWSVGDEVIFYAIFPLVFPLWQRLSLLGATLATIVLVFAVCQLNAFTDTHTIGLTRLFTGLWFPAQLPCFVFGLWLGKIATEPAPRWVAITVLTLSAIAAIALAFPPYPKAIVRLGLTTSYGLVFALFIFGLMNFQPRLLVNRAIGWIGKVSFSAYLLHFAFIPMLAKLGPFESPTLGYFVILSAMTACTVGAASLTYLLIERPMIRLGNSVVARLRESRAVLAAA